MENEGIKPDQVRVQQMTPQERAATPVEVRQALADKVKNLIVSNLTHEENQLWLANVDAFEERAYQRGRRAALLEACVAVSQFSSDGRPIDAQELRIALVQLLGEMAK